MTNQRRPLDTVKHEKASVLDLRQMAQPAPHIPVSPRPTPVARRGTQATMDSFRYGLNSPRPVMTPKTQKAPVSSPVPAATSQPQAVAKPASSPRRRRKIWSIVQYPLIAGVALGAAYTTSIGQWFVLAYGVIALIRRLDSRYSFGAALFALICVPLFSVLGQSGISANIAVYVYELLVVGTVQAVIELRRSGVTAS
jgi:hypothetical protein